MLAVIANTVPGHAEKRRAFLLAEVDPAHPAHAEFLDHPPGNLARLFQVAGRAVGNFVMINSSAMVPPSATLMWLSSSDWVIRWRSSSGRLSTYPRARRRAE